MVPRRELLKTLWYAPNGCLNCVLCQLNPHPGDFQSCSGTQCLSGHIGIDFNTVETMRPVAKQVNVLWFRPAFQGSLLARTK